MMNLVKATPLEKRFDGKRKKRTFSWKRKTKEKKQKKRGKNQKGRGRDARPGSFGKALAAAGQRAGCGRTKQIGYYYFFFAFS